MGSSTPTQPEGEVVRARVVVSGRVQGVFFRQDTYRLATSRDVKGWVRNREDGTLEAVFEGDDAAVGRMIEWCRRGPRMAHVDSLAVDWEAPRGERSFRIR